jgi:biopolymer transport protein TolQ
MEELGNVARLIAEADLIIKSVLSVLLFQSVFIWFSVIQFIFRARRVRSDQNVMLGALVNADVENVRRVLLSFAHLRPFGAGGAGRQDEASTDEIYDSVWDEIFESLTARCSGLGTVAATAPFIGLFGTVWGILVAFSSIRSAEAITFSALAPAIGEALFATMAGLFVAIPSVVANNWVASRSQIISRECTQAYMELVNELRRLGRKPGEGEW